MYSTLTHALTIRQKFLTIVNSLSVDQLNVIPEKFSNNIAWHLGHLAVSTESLCYTRTGIEPDRKIQGFDHYKNGSRPEGYINLEEIEYYKDKLIKSLEDIDKDYQNQKFEHIKSFATLTFGIEMHTIEEVFQFCTYHDLLHYGNVLAMKKLV